MALFQIFVDTPVNGLPSLFRIDSVYQIVHFSFPRFVGLLILSLWLEHAVKIDKRQFLSVFDSDIRLIFFVPDLRLVWILFCEMA
jgi:hypothetical protein